MKIHYPKKLLTLQNLQGGQFGTIDVTAVSDELVELDFAADFDRLTPDAARALIGALDRWLSQLPPPPSDDDDDDDDETIIVIKG